MAPEALLAKGSSLKFRPITAYTRLDQALALWGCVTAVIFGMAQLSGLAWPVQAMTDSILTLAAIVLTIWLTWYWTSVKPFRWVVYFWSLLMLVGIGLTDYGIFRPVGFLLVNLCPGWLGLCALGYLLTSIGMQARALTLIGLACIIHDDLQKSSKPLSSKGSGDLSKKQSAF